MRVVHSGGEIDVGRVEATPTISLADFSRRVTDDFGVTTVVPRAFSRRVSVRLAVPSDEVDYLQRQFAALRATAAQWIVDEQSAWLNFEGFYKDFEVDLALPPLSYCTLTIEGLAETEAAANPIGDPAPNGSSTLRMVRPIDVTDGMLTSNIPETDHPEWTAGTSYALGARVIKAAAHSVYESAAAANLGNDPAAASGHWLEVGPTNRWAMLDEALGTVSSRANSIVVTIDAEDVNALALLDVTGATVRVQTTAYNRIVPVTEGAITFLDMPLANAPVTVTVTGGGTVSVGTLLLGRLMTLGTTEASPKAALIDFSKKDADEFGDVTIVERAWAKRMDARALIRTDAIDLVANRLAAVRARPALWFGDAEFDSLTVYGFAKEWSVERNETVSTLTLSIEGMSKAAVAAPGTNGAFNPRGEYDPGAFYAVGDVVAWPGSIGGTDDSYVRIGTGSTIGISPADGVKWAIFVPGGADGTDGTDGVDGAPGAPGDSGVDGKLVEFVWKRAATVPATPTGNGIPSGWSDNPPLSDGNPLWMSKAKQELDGTLFTSWSTPIRHDGPPGIPGVDGTDGINGDDGIFREFVWKRAAALPATPTGNGIPAGWSDDPPTGSDPLWMSVAKQELDGTLIDTWSAPIRHDGPKGDQGDQGPPGTAEVISLRSTQTQAKFNGAGVYTGGSITFLTTRQNIPTGAVWGFKLFRTDTGEVQAIDTAAGLAAASPTFFSTSGPANLTLSATAVSTYINAWGGFAIEAFSDGYADTDRISIAKLQDGANGSDGTDGTNGAPGAPGDDGADGVDGADGFWRERVFLRAPTVPATPTGNGIPSGWQDDPYPGAEPLWESWSKQELDGTLIGVWSTPVRHDGPAGADGDDGEDAVTVSPGAAWSIASSQNGTPNSGQLPRSLTMKVMRGATDITGDVLTVFALTTPSGFSGSLGGTNNSVFTATAISADDAKATITVSYNGTPVGTVEVQMNKVRAGSAASQFSEAVTSFNATASYILTNDFDLNLPAGASLSVEASALYTASGGSFRAEMKVSVQNITDSGVETDLTIGSDPIQWPSGENGEVYAATATTSPGHASAKLYRIRLYTRRLSGTGSATGISGALYARTS